MNQNKQIREARNRIRMRKVRKFVRNRMALICTAIIFVMVFLSAFAPLLTPYDPVFIDMSMRNLPMSGEHLLGTDNMGRDLFARILYGGRMSMFIGVAGSLGGTLLGVILGCLAGYLGGKLDDIIVYISELLQTFPGNLLVMLMVGILGRSVTNLLIMFALTGWTQMMRIVRTNVLSLREEPFVESCRANGISSWSIMFHHIMPNTLGPVIVTFSLGVSSCIMREASLSFLGLGVADTTVTWGSILNAAKRLDVIQNMPVLWLAPGIAICLFVLCMNFLGDGLRDVLDSGSV